MIFGKKSSLRIRELYRTEGEQVNIDVKISGYDDFFSDWDYAPVRMRDLNDDLYSYLLDCCMEIPERYVIRIVLHLPESLKDGRKEESNRTGYRNYMKYRLRVNTRERKAEFLRTGWCLLFGVLFIGAGYFLDHYGRSFYVISILKEGFFIGGWVLFWELFSSLFFNDREIRRRISMIRRLHKAELLFLYQK